MADRGRATEMTADDVRGVLDLLDVRGIHVWVDGGWAVDACLGTQTRRHSDLDIVLEQRDRSAAEALAGTGTVAGRTVDCITPEWLVRFHTGYEVDATDWADVSALCERFAIPVPDEYLRFQ